MSLIDGAKTVGGSSYSGMMGDPVGMGKSTPSDPQQELMQCIQFMIQDLGLKDTEARQLVEYAIQNIQQISPNPKDAISFLKSVLGKVANQSAGKVTFDKLKIAIDKSLESIVKKMSGGQSGRKSKPSSGIKKEENGGIIDMVVPMNYICPEGTVAVFEEGGELSSTGDPIRKKVCKRCRAGGSVTDNSLQSMFSKDTLDAIMNNSEIQYGAEGMQMPEAEEVFQRIPGGYRRSVTFNGPGYSSSSYTSTSTSINDKFKDILKKIKGMI